MSDADIRRNPQIVNVVTAISAQTGNYNIPGLNNQNLKLNGPGLAGIYTGKIRLWDDSVIATLNPGVKLPHNDIVPIHRSDPSGDTFVFTQYLTFSIERWEKSHRFRVPESWQKRLGFGTSRKAAATCQRARAQTTSASPTESQEKGASGNAGTFFMLHS